MKRLLTLFAIFASISLSAAAQQSIVDYIEKLHAGDNAAITRTIYREHRDPKTQKLQERIIILDFRDKAIAKELRKRMFNERAKADDFSLDDSPRNKLYYISFNQVKGNSVDCKAVCDRMGNWQVLLHERFH